MAIDPAQTDNSGDEQQFTTPPAVDNPTVVDPATKDVPVIPAQVDPYTKPTTSDPALSD